MNRNDRPRRLSLLQQWRYDSFRLLFFVAVLLSFSAVVYWIFPLFGRGNTHAGLTGILCGQAAVLWLTAISRLRLAYRVPEQKLNEILNQFHYCKTPQGFYDLPVASFKKFKAQRIYVDYINEQMVLIGPYNILKKIAKVLPSVDVPVKSCDE